MERETKGEFAFDWNIEINYLISLSKGHSICSPIAKAERLKRTQWFLQLCWELGYPVCYLKRNDFDESGEILMTVTLKLEMIDSEGRTLKSVVKREVSFSKGSFSRITDFLTADTMEFLKQSGKMSAKDTLTIRCHIVEERQKKKAMTWDTPTVFQAQWKINTPGHLNWSKKIKVPFYKYTHIDLILSATSDRINIKIGEVELQLLYKLKITVLNDEDLEIDFKGSKNIFQSTDEDQNFEISIEKSQLVNKSCLGYSFTLICIVYISESSSASEFESYSFGNIAVEPFLRKTVSRLTLQEDLKEMLLKEKHSDIKLRVNDKFIPAHKCLLSVRSPVFSTMFDQDMLETQTGIVDIPDVEIEILRAFLEFLYTDTITNTDYTEVLKLMLLADKYQVDILKEGCSVILMSKLSIENVCEVISLAEMVNHLTLKDFAFEYMKKNKKDIISSPAWSEWVKQNLNLAVEILSKIITD